MAEAVATTVAKAFYWMASKAAAKVWVARAVAATAYHVSQLAITAAISYGLSQLTRPRTGSVLGGELDLSIDSDFPRQWIVGTRAVAGSLVAHFSTGANNNNLHLVYALADHPCVALKRVWADGRIVRDTALSHGVRTEITAYSYSGGPRVWFTWWDGRPGQVADTNLISVSGGEWTSDHKGAGVSYVHVELQIDSDILTSVPRFLWEVQGAKLYNRRKDSTAGGSGAHRLNDPSTWEYSENPMDALQHFLLGYKVEDEDLAFGVGLPVSEIPYAPYAAAADLSDEDVLTGPDGSTATIKRYAANGIVGADLFFEDVVTALQAQMGARLVDLGGRIGILGAEARPSVVDLSEADWVTDESVSYEDKRRFAELFGAVEGRYSDPGNLYQPAEIQRQEVVGLTLPDGGEMQTQTLDLPFETHPRRAARLASLWLEREQRQARLSGRMGVNAWELEAGDWFTYSSEIEQLEDALFEVIDIVHHEDLTVTLTAQAVDADMVAFDRDNDPDLSVPAWIDPEDLLLAVPTFTVAQQEIASGAIREPALRFRLTSSDALARELVIEWRRWDPAGAGSFTGDSYFDVSHRDQEYTTLRKGIMPSAQFKVRAKLRAGRRESAWTAWSAAVTTTTLYSVGAAASVDWSGVTGTGRPSDHATRNQVYVGATAPAPGVGEPAIVNGDLWLDTSANPFVWKVRSGGAWTSAASLGGIFGSTVYESAGVAATLSAFKTSLGTAAAITAQGDLATTNRSALPFGANAVRDAQQAAGLRYRSMAWDTIPAAPSFFSLTDSGVDRFVQLQTPAVAALGSGNFYAIVQAKATTLAESARLPVGRVAWRVGVSVDLPSAFNRVWARLMVFNSAGTWIASSEADYNLVGGGQVLSGFYDAAADYGYVLVVWAQLKNTVTVSRQLNTWKPFICSVPSGQTVLPPWSPGPDADTGADVTASNTAAAFTGQGALATRNTVTNLQITQPGDVNLSRNNWVDIASITVTAAAGERVVIDFLASVNALLSAGTAGTSVQITLAILRGATTLKTFRGPFEYEVSSTVGAQVLDSAPLKYAETPGAGTFTYKVQILLNSTNNSFAYTPYASDIFMSALTLQA